MIIVQEYTKMRGLQNIKIY